MNGVKDTTPGQEAACLAVLEELDGLAVGSGVKQRLRRLAMSSLFFDRAPGMMAFVGQPGTGKTHVAQKMGKLLYSCGSLPTDKVVFCSRSDLISGYIGATVGKTRAVCQEALGGVLVLEDAWQLAGIDGAHSPFDAEALMELLSFADTHRDQLCLILTGDVEPMQRMLEADPLLRCKTEPVILFEPFDRERLTEVFVQTARQDGVQLGEGVREAAQRAFGSMLTRSPGGIGNARGAIRFYERCKLNLAQRLLSKTGGDISKIETYVMRKKDVPKGQEETQ